MKFLAFMYRYRFIAVAVMVGCSGLNSLRFIGEWSNFWSVVASQCLFGRGFYCYIANKPIYYGPQGMIEADHPRSIRFLAGIGALSIYLFMFAFNGYGREWR